MKLFIGITLTIRRFDTHIQILKKIFKVTF